VDVPYRGLAGAWRHAPGRYDRLRLQLKYELESQTDFPPLQGHESSDFQQPHPKAARCNSMRVPAGSILGVSSGVTWIAPFRREGSHRDRTIFSISLRWHELTHHGGSGHDARRA